MKSIILFIPEFRNGELFVSKIDKICSNLELELNVVYVTKETNPMQQQHLLVAAHFADIVLVDCTIPKDGKDGGVYPALIAQVNSLNHIIAFSQNYLPLNVTPFRTIAPSLEKQEMEYSMDKILEELPKVIEKSLKEDKYRRINEKYIQDFIENTLDYQKQMEQMISDSLEARKNKDCDKTHIMISYRNSHKEEVEVFEKIILGTDALSAQKRIEMGCHDTYDIHRLPPASLCGEFEAHTPMRRWMLVGMLEDYIRKVEEVWVYESTDTNGDIDYTNSWWTIAEVIMVANINQTQNKNIQVRVYSAKDKCFYDKTPSRYEVHLNEKQIKRLARYLSNTRPDTMGPECMDQVKQLQEMAKVLRECGLIKKQLLLAGLRSSFEQSVPKLLPPKERRKMIEDLMDLYSDPNKIEEYANDAVFQNDFWTRISYQTKPRTECFHDGNIDVDRFLSIPMDEVSTLTQDDFLSVTKDGSLLNFGTITEPQEMKVSKAPIDRYLWLATRMGQPTIKEGNVPGLERIPIYNIERI